MSGKCFLDTNILVYMESPKETEKQQKARLLFDTLTSNGLSVISTQCLQEFYNATTKKLNLDKLQMKELIHTFEYVLDIVQITPRLIEDAIDISIETQFSFWDSLIIAAAVYAECDILYSEDLNDGQVVRGVTIKNPFC